MKKLTAILILLLLSGCMGIPNYNKFIEKNVPDGKCDNLSIESKVGPYNVTIEAEKFSKAGGKISADKLHYKRNGNISATKVTLEGYERDVTVDGY